MYERPLHMKYSLERMAVAEQLTQCTTAMRLPKVTAKLPVTEPMLPLDQLRRPYLVSFERWTNQGLLWDNTVYQVWQLVDDYRRLSGGCYPSEIVLCARRYAAKRLRHFYPLIESGAKPIPFKYEDENASYEILVRGAV